MVALCSDPAEVIVVKPDSEFARLVSRDHVPEGVVEVSLVASPDDKAAIVVRHEVKVTVGHDSVTAVEADVDATFGHLDADDVTVNIVSESPVVDAVIALDALKLAVDVVNK